MTTIVWVTAPIVTITIDTTVQQAPGTAATQSSGQDSFSTSITTTTSTTFLYDTVLSNDGSSTSALPSSSTFSSSTAVLSTSNNFFTSLPMVILNTGAASQTISAISPTSSDATAQATSAGSLIADSYASDEQWQHHHKQVIIGSLCGAIFGALLIGLAICLLLRCYKRRTDPNPSELPSTEQSHDDTAGKLSSSPPAPATTSFKEKLASLAATAAATTSVKIGRKKRNRQTIQPDSNASSVTVDEDHHIIRMSTHHWPRPYAPGEGYRDSCPPGVLRVTNPDRTSIPPTPRGSSDTMAGPFLNFLRRPRSALAAAAAAAGGGSGSIGGGSVGAAAGGSIPRSRASSRSFVPWHHQQQQQQQQHRHSSVVTRAPNTATERSSLSHEYRPSASAPTLAPSGSPEFHGEGAGRNFSSPHSILNQPRNAVSGGQGNGGSVDGPGSDPRGPGGPLSSHPSLGSLPLVQQRPPDDLFFPYNGYPATEQDDHEEEDDDASAPAPDVPRHRRPSSSTHSHYSHTYPSRSGTPLRAFHLPSPLDASSDVVNTSPTRARPQSRASSTLETARATLSSLFQPHQRPTAIEVPGARYSGSSLGSSRPVQPRARSSTLQHYKTPGDDDGGVKRMSTGVSSTRSFEAFSDAGVGGGQEYDEDSRRYSLSSPASSSFIPFVRDSRLLHPASWARRSDPFDLDRASLRDPGIFTASENQQVIAPPDAGPSVGEDEASPSTSSSPSAVSAIVTSTAALAADVALTAATAIATATAAASAALVLATQRSMPNLSGPRVVDLSAVERDLEMGDAGQKHGDPGEVCRASSGEKAIPPFLSGALDPPLQPDTAATKIAGDEKGDNRSRSSSGSNRKKRKRPESGRSQVDTLR